MVWSVRVALAATAVLLAAPGAMPAAASTPSATQDRLERFWRDTYTPRAKTAQENRFIPLLAKAPADECYKGPGGTYVAKTGVACDPDRVNKVNQAYVWGLAKSGQDLWMGTAPNTLCLVIGEMGRAMGVSLPPIVNDAWSCEFGASGFRASLPDPTSLLERQGDWRPPKMYRYKTVTGEIEDVTVGLPAPAAELLQRTLGIRSAGALGRVVFLAGPSRSAGGFEAASSVIVFAFDAVTGKFIQAKEFSEYTDIRRWIVAGGKLYTAVGTSDGKGALLRWDGDPNAPGTADAPSASLFALTSVGKLPMEGADLTEHQGRIYVTSWSTKIIDPDPGGVFVSRPLDQMTGPAPDMDQVWSASEYEPDPQIARTYLGGAIASYDGHLVWGTIHAPMVGGLKWIQNHGVGDPAKIPAALLGGWRASTLFSATNPANPATRQVRVLYGNAILPVYDEGDDRWVLRPNKMLQVPKYGQAGFDNPFNNYMWAMSVTDHGLWVGTMDWSFLLNKLVPTAVEMLLQRDLPPGALEMPRATYGADLMKFSSMDRPARSVSRSGAGNFANYGIRTMVSDPARLYLGTANPMNLLPQGGWELRRIGPGEEPIVVEEQKPQPPAAVTTTEPSKATPRAGTAASRICVSRRHFTMHLGFRLKVATARSMRNVKTITATVNGKRVKVRRTTRGLTLPVDLRGTPAGRAKVSVKLTLHKAVRVQRRDGGTARTSRIARTWLFMTCR